MSKIIVTSIKGTETAAAEPDEAPPVETKSPNTGQSNLHSCRVTFQFTLLKYSDDKPPPEVDSAAVEAMYSVVSKEHCEKKRKANLQIQPYDDVVLSMEVGTKPQDHANEGGESQLQNANPEDTGYSRLCHPGPRMSQTKKPEHLSYELLKQDARKGSLSAANLKNGSYSEVQPSPRPSSQVIVPANYTLIDDKEVLPPPLPSRLSVTIPLPSIPLPQKMPNSSPENTENIPKTNAYETIDATPSVTDEEFLMQGLCMTEFHSTQAEKNTVTKGDYDVLKSP